jgi:hypothetical protein
VPGGTAVSNELLLAIVAVIAAAWKTLDWWMKREARKRDEAEEKVAQTEPSRQRENEMVLLRGMQAQIRDLHIWHTPEDANGVKRWWTPVDLTTRITNIEITLERVMDLASEVTRLNARIDELQDLRLEEAREAGDRLLEFATKIERGVAGSRRLSVEDEVDTTEDGED